MTPITWRGLTADYTDHERATMRQLPPDEAAILHGFKALLGARIIEPPTRERGDILPTPRPEPPEPDQLRMAEAA